MRYIGKVENDYDLTTKRYVDSKVGGSAIIKVDTLPTENIREDVLYEVN